MMDNSSEASRVSSALKQCQDIQHMIDITSQHLERLRSTFDNAGDELTMQEIRTLEGKLIKQFSGQLAVKYGLGSSHGPDLVYFPSLSQWLVVVGVSSETNDAIKSRVKSLEELKDKTECELKRILITSSRVSPRQIPEDLRRLCRSLMNLRKYTDALMYSGKMYGPSGDPSKLELHWDSWDTLTVGRGVGGDTTPLPAPSPKHDTKLTGAGELLRSVPVRLSTGRSAQAGGSDSAASSLSSSSSVPPPSPGPASILLANTLSPPSFEGTGPAPRSTLITPPATPPWANINNKDTKGTPPCHNKVTNEKPVISSVSNQSQLSKSKSHEAELSNRLETDHGDVGDQETVGSSGYSSSSETTGTGLGRVRLPSSDPESSGHEMSCGPVPSPIASPKSPGSSKLSVPKSPRTPGGGLNTSLNRPMTHTIAHRFKKTFQPARCDFCQEYFFQGLKCKECKFRCHTQCEQKVPKTCGLPNEFLECFLQHLTTKGSPSLPRQPPPIIQAPFDSSSSSCNSSTPSSPQVIVTTHPDTNPTPPYSAAIRHTPHSSHSTHGDGHFRFPEPSPHYRALMDRVSVSSDKSGSTPGSVGVDTVTSNQSNDSDKTLSGSSDRSDSIGTAYNVRLDSQDSTTSVEGDIGSTWSSGKQMSIKEWDIPLEELKVGDKIGTGRFSTVHAGNWHGDVAIKFLDMENADDEAALEAFRLDVATFRKTRHENLVLFMGACMKPPRLAIVTSLCKGNTLYTHLHLRKDKFFMNKVILIAQQIAQGMGYLHHRGIVHKDLKTKNIFLENGRAIITDFGLVNVARRLCSRHKKPGEKELISVPSCMSIPAGWLCYLAPEVIRQLRIHQEGKDDLPFTRSSDVYAFGTVWYELLTGEWPWKHQPPESIIWQVGMGMKPSLANLAASKEVKDVLMACWVYNADHRPGFPDIGNILDRLPKKRLARSPSHPIQLSRSAESVF